MLLMAQSRRLQQQSLMKYLWFVIHLMYKLDLLETNCECMNVEQIETCEDIQEFCRTSSSTVSWESNTETPKPTTYYWVGV